MSFIMGKPKLPMLPAAPSTPMASRADTAERTGVAFDEMRRRAAGGVGSTMFAGQAMAYEQQQRRAANRLLGGGA